jgi:hypothetical protein
MRCRKPKESNRQQENKETNLVLQPQDVSIFSSEQELEHVCVYVCTCTPMMQLASA